MSKINNSITSIFLRQIYLITKHQDLADCNAPNQLMEMVESLNVIAEAIGNSNASMITSVDEETLNVYIARVQLEVNEKFTSDSDEDG
jgi:hypothetical protein